ncbi:MAG: hypothetical protein L3J31_04040 [Bacteroidales bacterium]|nr:hypothetical protein [Bacteroidales bacterium]MCF6341957.1 hypothetical protein [Bacteroidales bacterium]
MSFYLKIINVFLLATVKFFYAPLYGFALGLAFWETVLVVAIGGISSFFFFYYITNLFLVYVRHFKPLVVKVTPHRTRLYYRNWQSRKKEKRRKKKIFTGRNKLFVRARRTYGMWGIVLLMPVVLSIPLGAFLLRKYYGHRKEAIPAALIALALEGLVTAAVFWFFLR